MAERRVRPVPEAMLKVFPWLCYRVDCRWITPILGTRPATDTMVSHLARIGDDLVDRLAREARRQLPSDIMARESVSGAPQNGDARQDADAAEQFFTQRREILEEILKNNRVDPDTKRVLSEALRDKTPAEIMEQARLQALNVFPRNAAGRLIVPGKWFQGGMKEALQRDNNMYRDAAQTVGKGLIIIRTSEIDLGTDKPDEVVTENIPLPSVRPGEAQATIKCFEVVDPRKHGKEEFQLMIMVDDSPTVLRMFNLPNPKEDPNAKPLSEQSEAVVHRLFSVVGMCGVGGNRPINGKFEVTACRQVTREEVEQ
ncbi:MAG: hypothetical protein WAP52_00155 [Candidatus Sungiibacteriota bacterium]